MTDTRANRDREPEAATRRTPRGKLSMAEIANASEPLSVGPSPSAVSSPRASENVRATGPADTPATLPPDDATGSSETQVGGRPRPVTRTIAAPRAADAKNLTIRLHPSTTRFLRHLATRRSCKVADIMRVALDDHLIHSGLPGIEVLDGMSVGEIDKLAATISRL